MVLAAFTLTAACLASLAALLVADRLGQAAWRVVAKLTASTCFVLVAMSLGAHRTAYGQFLLAALMLGWLGDTLLLSARAKAFMGGLAAFLISHVLYSAAFLSAAVSTPAMAVAAAGALAAGTVVLRWLLPHVPGGFKVAVLAYVIVILAMCVAAAGHAFAWQRWAALAGALLFAASDLFVARDRFVEPGFVNRLWGLPTYFGAQLILAWTVATPAGGA